MSITVTFPRALEQFGPGARREALDWVAALGFDPAQCPVDVVFTIDRGLGSVTAELVTLTTGQDRVPEVDEDGHWVERGGLTPVPDAEHPHEVVRHKSVRLLAGRDLPPYPACATVRDPEADAARQAEIRERRSHRARVTFTLEQVADALGLPGCEWVSFGYDPIRDQFNACVIHPDLPAVDEAMEAPLIPAVYEQTRDGRRVTYQLPIPAASATGVRCGRCRSCDPGGLRMYLCATCGNKRCPHANDCALECTHSNEPGQPGSAYE